MNYNFIRLPALIETPPAQHGAIDYGELESLGVDPQQVVDFSVNSNPFGPPPGVSEAIRKTPLERYPDRESLALRRALAQRLNVSISQIVCGNGSAELINAICFAFLQAGDPLLIIGPTFGEYERACRLVGAQVQQYTGSPEQQFTINSAEVKSLLLRSSPRLVFLCNPNNPTGACLPLEQLARWIKLAPHTLFIIDEAYLAFAASRPSALSLNADNLLVLHSLTKDYALAGLRLGYAAGPEPLIEAISRLLPPWNVNALAQAAGLAALADETYPQTLARLPALKQELTEGLQTLGLPVYPSEVHYFLAEVGNGADFRLKLLRQGLMVRDCASFGLPGFIRIATRGAAENKLLLKAVEKLVQT
jgi:histidinol-phosphate aminotransferase